MLAGFLKNANMINNNIRVVNDNFELFMEYVGKLSALIDESPTSNVAILSEFNVGIYTQFDAELQELCSNVDLISYG